MGVARPEGGSDRGPNIGNGGVRGDDEACPNEAVVDLPHPLSLTLHIIKDKVKN